MRKNGHDQLLQTIQLPKDLTRLADRLPKSQYETDKETNEATVKQKFRRNPQEAEG